MGRIKSGPREQRAMLPLLLVVVVVFVFVWLPGRCIAQGGQLTRGSFPKGFVFGTAAAAYQYEGAVKVDGRGQTIWDTFAHTFGKISDFSNADVAVDQYHRFQAGIDHYNKPYVTLYHWDLPQALEDRYNGWLDRQIVNDFAAYAEICFKEFGDRVKHWITINEPHTVAVQGYDAGLHAPGRCSVLLHLYCKSGNSGTEPYIVAHNFILAHATVADIYRRKYKTMRKRVAERLPKFTADESALVKGALDFMGINHYTTFYTRNNNTNIIGKLLNDTLADTGTVSLRQFHLAVHCTERDEEADELCQGEV
nr:unnamed protein product [Digitaria exilis]